MEPIPSQEAWYPPTDPPQPRSIGGWIYLTIVFALLVTLAISSQFTKKAAAVTPPIPNQISLGIAFLVGGILLAGLILWAIFIGLQVSRALPAPNRSLLEISLSESDRYAARIAQLLTVYIGVSLLAELAGKASSSSLSMLIFGLGQMALSLLVFLVPIHGEPLGLRRIGWSKERFGRNAGLGALAAVMNYPVVFCLLILGTKLFSGMPAPSHPIAEGLRDNHSAAYVALAMFSGCIQAPITEETMFRGLLFPALARIGLGPILAALLSSLVFAAIHPTGFSTLLGLAAIGCMSCYLVYRTGSLIPSMFMHATHNCITLLIALTL